MTYSRFILIAICTICFAILTVGKCPTRLQEGLCARVYEHGSCRGRFLNIWKHTEYFLPFHFKTLEKKISSIVLHPSCDITVHDEYNYDGHSRKFERYSKVLLNLGSWNDVISSIRCECGWTNNNGQRG